MFILGEKVVLIGNPLDEQLGENMDGGIHIIEQVKDTRHMAGTSGQWVKTDKHNDWVDSSYFVRNSTDITCSVKIIKTGKHCPEKPTKKINGDDVCDKCYDNWKHLENDNGEILIEAHN